MLMAKCCRQRPQALPPPRITATDDQRVMLLAARIVGVLWSGELGSP